MSTSAFLSSIPTMALAVSVFALIISIWTRIEAYTSLKRQRRIDLVRRVGEALVAAQLTKNELSELANKLGQAAAEDSQSLSVATREAFAETFKKTEADYATISEIVKAFEGIIIAFEHGQSGPIDASVIEAKIARFNQIQALAVFDSAIATKLLGKSSEASEVRALR